jgi:hypothetical protein
MKKIFIFIVLLWTIIATVSAVQFNMTNWVVNTNWFFNSLWNSNITVSQVDENSTAYTDDWDRITILQPYQSDPYTNVWTWILVSAQYWDFYIKDGPILLKESSDKAPCDNHPTYTFTWSLYSPSFWTVDIQNWSYYCPLSGSSSLTISSDLLWAVTISWISTFGTSSVVNSRWETVTINQNLVFDNKKISINWINNIRNISWLESEYSNNTSIKLDYNVEWKMAKFNRNINKNLAKYTRWISPITTNNLVLSWFGNKINYYDFEWQKEASKSNKDNKWKILTLWTWEGRSWISDYNMMTITWQKLLYIKWWNLYIKADIHNASDYSQLVIVVKRDSNNKENWGNVYIDPGVTNIDATIIADWSIMSYNWNDVLNAIDNWDSLRNQLLIYGSISTKNTFWEDKAIYGTDDYISNLWREISNVKQYNLANLRSFQVMLNDGITTWDCKYDGTTSQIVARDDTWTWALQYAFAGKKKCFVTDSTNNDLRWTDKLAWLVIEYNPNIQTNPHFILKK